MKTGEQFECSNCFHSGPLDAHGRCERCYSHAVLSLEVISDAAGFWLGRYHRETPHNLLTV